MGNSTFEIDNITWNDLSLDDIYARLNSCKSSAGEDFLYYRLRNPYITECEEFKEQRELFDEVKGSDSFNQLILLTETVGKLKKYKFKDVILEFQEATAESNVKHWVINLLTVLAFALIFIFPGPGIVAFFIMVAYAVSDYFKTKNIIAAKLYVFNYIIKMIKALNTVRIGEVSDKENILNKYLNRLKEIANDFSPFTRFTFLISEGAKTNSNPFSLVFDYIRMIFHVDIIKYNSMISFLKNHISEAEEYYNIIGCIDTAICFSNIADSNELYIQSLCKPKRDSGFKMTDAYHPMIKNVVVNSVNTDRNILITGCNASGKSTFLKTVALNALFSQSFGITFAKEYCAPFYEIYSSMALRDDIDSKESYFMAEIKSLKRIIDANENENSNILCVIDEVLRGTNTVERIAASVEILKSFSNKNTLCFAATHDIELTELLSDCFDNYHFTEEVLEDDVVFSFKIYEGAAKSRNAIRLLSVLGYDSKIVENASKRADSFIENGVWA